MTHSEEKKCASALYKLLVEKKKELTGALHAELNPWLEKESIAKIVESSVRVAIVANVFKKEDPVDVNKFYYPSQLHKKGANPHVNFYAEGLSDFCTDNSIIIEGTVGQGKSILLRYLHRFELSLAESIPLFIELRDVGKESLLDYISNHIKSELSMRCSRELASRLIDIGVFSLFFDGFDEVEPVKRSRLTNEIREMARRNGTRKTICTSRPNNEIQSSAEFDVFCINPLGNEDQIKFISKLMDSYEENSKHRIQLGKNISGMKEDLRCLLQTPLVLTLFAIVYRRSVKIPDSKTKFYKMLFNTLVSEHDGMKIGFTRPTLSGLSAEEFHLVLEYISFLFISKRYSSSNEIDFVVLVNGALRKALITKGTARKVLDDLTKNTCLIEIDNHTHKFIHDSIPFYFAASCVRSNTSDQQSEAFYKERINKLDVWSNILDFLEDIDDMNFNRFYLKKQIESYFIRRELENNRFLFNRDSAIRFLHNFVFTVIRSKVGGDILFTSITFVPRTDWFASKYFISSDIIVNKVNLDKFTSGMRVYFESITKKKLISAIDKSSKSHEKLDAKHQFIISSMDLLPFLDKLNLIDEAIDNLNLVPFDALRSVYDRTKVATTNALDEDFFKV
ncbi:NACHT domain-containing protein [Enterovibrio calviensis]|uniref:NACHT domain-containing protein n=1 Tax=Enterovibrio calviensis TaxID=91359 RepID=UPI00048783AC|nr:hypothetical protein [Enterovibrio calviensis]